MQNETVSKHVDLAGTN